MASRYSWQSCRPNLEVADLGPATAFLRDVLGFTVEMEEQAMGLVLLSRDAVGLTGVAFVPTQLLLLLVVGGMALGCVGGFVVARTVR